MLYGLSDQFVKLTSLFFVGGSFYLFRQYISYGLYLYGWPVQKLLINKFGPDRGAPGAGSPDDPGISPVAVFFLSMAIAAACACVSWYGVERWFLKLKPKPAADRGPAMIGKHGDRRTGAGVTSAGSGASAIVHPKGRKRERRQKRAR